MWAIICTISQALHGTGPSTTDGFNILDRKTPLPYEVNETTHSTFYKVLGYKTGKYNGYKTHIQSRVMFIKDKYK